MFFGTVVLFVRIERTDSLEAKQNKHFLCLFQGSCPNSKKKKNRQALVLWDWYLQWAPPTLLGQSSDSLAAQKHIAFKIGGVHRRGFSG